MQQAATQETNERSQTTVEGLGVVMQLQHEATQLWLVFKNELPLRWLSDK
jgi:hypothetical protein